MTGKEKRKRPITGKALLRPPQTTAEVGYYESGTGAEVLRPVRTSGSWALPSGSTTDAEEQEEAVSPLATTFPALVDKHVFARLSARGIFVLLWLALMGVIIWKDNSTGLTDWPELRWTLTKCALITGFFIAAGGLMWLFMSVRSWGRWLWERRPWR